MAYHDLSECTLTPDERRAEATHIVEIITDSDGSTNDWSESEKKFFNQMCDPDATVSVKQLFWLRDIKDKYL